MKKSDFILIALIFTGALVSLQSCDNDTETTGRTEPLDIPGNITHTATHNAVTVRWAAVEDAVAYTVQLRGAEDTTDELRAETNTAEFTGLESGTEYSVRIKAVATETPYDSAYSEWVTVSTAAQPTLAVPDDLSISDVTANSAVVSWSEVENAGSYTLEVKDDAGEATESYDTTENEFTITELDAETSYTVRVMATGGGDHLDSEFSQWVSFTTPEGDVAENFKGGTGTETDPYLVATPGQLMLMAQKVNNEEEGYTDAYYKLDSDIDLTGREWVPIGSGEGSLLYDNDIKKPFDGHMDGGGYTVSNLDCTVSLDADGCFAGLFGINQGTIQNINVKGNVTSASIYAGNEGYSYAGGICVLNRSMGVITDCTFSGSVKATSATDPMSYSAAAGICAYQESGQIDNCTVVVGENEAIEAFGCNVMAAGICGYASAGRLSGNKSEIDGNIEASVIGDDNTISSGAAAAGIAGSTHAIIFQNCETIIRGKLTADNPYGTASAAGICGSTEADIFAGMKADISGRLEATSAAAVAYTAGIIGIARGAYVIGGFEADISGELSAVSTGANKGAYVAGIGCNIGLTANAVSASNCASRISGSLYVEAPNAVFAAGVMAQQVGNLSMASTVMTSSSKVEMKGGQQQYFGGVLGAAASANTYGSYAILEGTVKGTSDQLVQIGGITGAFGGAISTTGRRAVTACYAIITGTITAETSAAGYAGGITGGSGRYGTMNADYWWCSNSSVVQPNGANASATGATELTGRSRADFEAILDDLNTAAADYNIKYEYDQDKGYLVTKMIE